MGQVATLDIGTNTYSVYALTTDPVDDANDYFSARLGASAWTDATTADKKRALVSAVRWMDRSVTWSGTVADSVTPQPLQWPRDGATCNGEAVPDGTVPDNLALAEFELALALLGDASAQDSSGQGSNVKSVGAGSAQVEFFSSTVDTSTDTRLPQPAHDLVKCYFGSQGLIAGTASGVDSESAFGPCDFDRSEGFA